MITQAVSAPLICDNHATEEVAYEVRRDAGREVRLRATNPLEYVRTSHIQKGVKAGDFFPGRKFFGIIVAIGADPAMSGTIQIRIRHEDGKMSLLGKLDARRLVDEYHWKVPVAQMTVKRGSNQPPLSDTRQITEVHAALSSAQERIGGVPLLTKLSGVKSWLIDKGLSDPFALNASEVALLREGIARFPAQAKWTPEWLQMEAQWSLNAIGSETALAPRLDISIPTLREILLGRPVSPRIQHRIEPLIMRINRASGLKTCLKEFQNLLTIVPIPEVATLTGLDAQRLEDIRDWNLERTFLALRPSEITAIDDFIKLYKTEGPAMDPYYVSGKLEDARLNHPSYTWEDLAEVTGLSDTTLRGIIEGKISGTFQTRRDLLRALNAMPHVSPSETRLLRVRDGLRYLPQDRVTHRFISANLPGLSLAQLVNLIRWESPQARPRIAKDILTTLEAFLRSWPNLPDFLKRRKLTIDWLQRMARNAMFGMFLIKDVTSGIILYQLGYSSGFIEHLIPKPEARQAEADAASLRHGEVIEEIVFRIALFAIAVIGWGYFSPFHHGVDTVALALATTSFLFSAAHVGEGWWSSFINRFVAGLYLQLLWLIPPFRLTWSGNRAIQLHQLNNHRVDLLESEVQGLSAEDKEFEASLTKFEQWLIGERVRWGPAKESGMPETPVEAAQLLIKLLLKDLESERRPGQGDADLIEPYLNAYLRYCLWVSMSPYTDPASLTKANLDGRLGLDYRPVTVPEEEIPRLQRFSRVVLFQELIRTFTRGGLRSNESNMIHAAYLQLGIDSPEADPKIAQRASSMFTDMIQHLPAFTTGNQPLVTALFDQFIADSQFDPLGIRQLGMYLRLGPHMEGIDDNQRQWMEFLANTIAQDYGLKALPVASPNQLPDLPSADGQAILVELEGNLLGRLFFHPKANTVALAVSHTHEFDLPNPPTLRAGRRVLNPEGGWRTTGFGDVVIALYRRAKPTGKTKPVSNDSSGQATKAPIIGTILLLIAVGVYIAFHTIGVHVPDNPGIFAGAHSPLAMFVMDPSDFFTNVSAMHGSIGMLYLAIVDLYLLLRRREERIDQLRGSLAKQHNVGINPTQTLNELADFADGIDRSLHQLKQPTSGLKLYLNSLAVLHPDDVREINSLSKGCDIFLDAADELRDEAVEVLDAINEQKISPQAAPERMAYLMERLYSLTSMLVRIEFEYESYLEDSTSNLSDSAAIREETDVKNKIIEAFAYNLKMLGVLQKQKRHDYLRSPQRIDINAELRKLASLRSVDKSLLHNISLELPRASLIGWMDPDKFVEIIFTFIENTVYAAKRNDTPIRIRVEVQTSGYQRHIRIDYSDLAGGMAKEIADRVFKSRISSKPKGGLGTLVLKKTIEVAGGLVDFVTQTGLGTTFSILLPLIVYRGTRQERILDRLEQLARRLGIIGRSPYLTGPRFGNNLTLQAS